MPTVGASGLQFDPDRTDYLSPEAGGRLGAISAGLPRWAMRITLSAMRMEAAAQWRAFLDVQRGPQRPFVAFDIDRQLPLAHRGGRPFHPRPGSWAQAVTGEGLALLTLGGLVPGQIVSMGDYVGFAWEGHLALTRAVETVQAGVGGSAQFAVEPPVPPIVPHGAAVSLTRAGCLMRLVPGETKLAGSAIGVYASGSTIVAIQDVIA
ncbi:hypothetical protein [Sphingomonas jinjuensis]|nr:hypothetical protein [Sphingomonas jinjuensis]